MEEKSNEDYTPIKYKLKNSELGLNGFYEYKMKDPNQLELRKITCENYAKNTDEENSKCEDFKNDVDSGKLVVIDLNKETRYIKFLKNLVEMNEYEKVGNLPDNLTMTERDIKLLENTDNNKLPEQGGKRKTRRHRKNSKKNRSSKKRKSNKKKRKTVKKRHLRKQK